MLNITTLLIAFVVAGPRLTDPWVVEKLNLSDEQVQKIHQIHEKYQLQRIDIRSQIAKKRVELASLWRSDNPDANKIGKLVKEIGDLRTQARLLGARERLEIRNVLTDEQLKKFRKMVWARRHAPRRGAWPGDNRMPARRPGAAKGMK